MVSNDRLLPLCWEIFRVLVRDAWTIVLCDFETILHLKPAAEEAGFEFRRPAVWDKVHHGLGYPFMGQHEFIVPLKKGRPPPSFGVGSVIRAKRVSPRRAYPAEKPVELMRTLVEKCSFPGQLVMDPFMGAGTTGEAALLLDRDFAGSDIKDRSGADDDIAATAGVPRRSCGRQCG